MGAAVRLLVLAVQTVKHQFSHGSDEPRLQDLNATVDQVPAVRAPHGYAHDKNAAVTPILEGFRCRASAITLDAFRVLRGNTLYRNFMRPSVSAQVRFPDWFGYCLACQPGALGVSQIVGGLVK